MANEPIKFDDIAALSEGLRAAIEELKQINGILEEQFKSLSGGIDATRESIAQLATTVSALPADQAAQGLESLTVATKQLNEAEKAYNETLSKGNETVKTATEARDDLIKAEKDNEKATEKTTETEKKAVKTAEEKLKITQDNIKSTKEVVLGEGDYERALNLNNKAIQSLNKAQKAGNISTEDYRAQIEALVNEQLEYIKTLDGSEEGQENNIKSTRELRNRYSQLKGTLDAAGDTLDKNSDQYKDLEKATFEAAEEIRNFDRATSGSNTLIGEYTKGILDSALGLTGMGGAVTQTSGFIGGMSSVVKTSGGAWKIFNAILLSSPIFILVGVLVAVFAHLTRAQEGVDDLAVAFEVINRTIDVVLDRLALLGKAAIAFAKGNFAEAANIAGQAFKGLGEEILEVASAAITLERASQRLRDEQIKFITVQAEARQEISRLILESRDQTKSVEERTAAIQAASKIEQDLLGQELTLKREELRILEERNELGNSLAGDIEAEQLLRADIIKLQTSENNSQRQLENRLTTLNKEKEKNNALSEKGIEIKTKEVESVEDNLARENQAEEKLQEQRLRRAVELQEDDISRVEKEIELQIFLNEQLLAQQFEFDAEKIAAEEQTVNSLLDLDRELNEAREEARVKRVNAEIDSLATVFKLTSAIALSGSENNKSLATANALINGAVAITKTFATLGFPLGIPAAAAQAANTALQIAAISNTSFSGLSVPAFKGGTKSAPGGLSLVGELGPELMLSNGRLSMLGAGKNGGMLANIPKGAEIFTARDTLQMIRESAGHENLTFNYDRATGEINGINQNAELLQAMDRNNPANAIVNGLSRIMSNKKESSFTWDERGFTQYQRNGESKTKIMNRKTRF